MADDQVFVMRISGHDEEVTVEQIEQTIADELAFDMFGGKVTAAEITQFLEPTGEGISLMEVFESEFQTLFGHKKDSGDGNGS